MGIWQVGRIKDEFLGRQAADLAEMAVSSLQSHRPKADVPIAKTDVSIAKADVSIAKADASIARTDASIARTDAFIAKADVSIARTDVSIARNAARNWLGATCWVCFFPRSLAIRP